MTLHRCSLLHFEIKLSRGGSFSEASWHNYFFNTSSRHTATLSDKKGRCSVWLQYGFSALILLLVAFIANFLDWKQHLTEAPVKKESWATHISSKGQISSGSRLSCRRWPWWGCPSETQSHRSKSRREIRGRRWSGRRRHLKRWARFWGLRLKRPRNICPQRCSSSFISGSKPSSASMNRKYKFKLGSNRAQC